MRRALILVVAIAACKYPELPQLSGGGSGVDAGGDGQIKIADAAIDAPRDCHGVPDTIAQASLGTAANPPMADWFNVPTTGPHAGTKEFVISAQLNGTPPITAIVIEVFRPSGGFLTNQPYTFETDATNNAYFVAAAMYGNFDSANGTSSIKLWASTGTITFTSMGETSGSNINGSISATNFREVDMATGTVISGGCTSMLQGITFFLKQQ